MTTAPFIKHVDGFKVSGLQVRTINSDEASADTAKIPALWHQFFSSDLAASDEAYGVYSNYESDVNGYYTLTAGVKNYHGPNQYHATTIQSGNFLVFEDTGPMPATVIATWQRVWDYFAKESKYQRNYKNDFEVYKGTDKVAIYIGVG